MTTENTATLIRRSASRLAEARNVIGLTKEDVQEALGMKEWELTALEAGTMVPTDVEFRKFARLYRRDVEWLKSEAPDAEVDTKIAEATASLSETDKEAVLRFARFLATQVTPSN